MFRLLNINSYSILRADDKSLVPIKTLPVAQRIEHPPSKRMVAGSNPAREANYSPVVQSVERWTVNPYVAGSSPARGARANKVVARAVT